VEEAASDALRAAMLIRTYRVRGHLAADLDPLGLNNRKLPADLTPEYHGFSAPRSTRRSIWAARWAAMGHGREIVAILRQNYCGKVGLEYMHIADTQERASCRSAWKAPTRASTSPRRQEGHSGRGGAR
jgi:2-oxoglutarate dehydrogenase E1 component